MKKITYLLLSIVLVCLLVSCNIERNIDYGEEIKKIKIREYTGVELVKLTYTSVDYMGGITNSFVFDLIANNASYKYDNPSTEEETDYNVFSEFDEESKKDFVNRIYTYGMFSLKERYETDEIIMDGGGWSLTLEFADGTTKTSSGSNAGPDAVFGYSAYAFYDLIGSGVVGYVPSSYYSKPYLGLSTSYRVDNSIFSDNSLTNMSTVDYRWNKQFSLNNDLYQINSDLASRTKLIAGVEYTVTLSTWNYDSKEKFVKFELWSYDFNEQLTNEKLIMTKGWFNQVDIKLEENKIYLYQITFEDGDFVQITFNSRYKDEKILYGKYWYSIYESGFSELNINNNGTFSLLPFHYYSDYIARTGITVDNSLPIVIGTYNFETIDGEEKLCLYVNEKERIVFKVYATSLFLDEANSNFNFELYNLITTDSNQNVIFIFRY